MRRWRHRHPEPEPPPPAPEPAPAGYRGSIAAEDMPPPTRFPSSFLAHRPVPSANAWPDDAVLVTYGELRRLVALHLDLARQGMPRDRPWDWVAMRAEAVGSGEVPLLLSEILTRDAL